MRSFSALTVESLMVEPLRYFFANYTAKQGLVWSPDDKVRTIEVGSMYDIDKIKLTEIPRVLINRGNFQITKSGLTDNMMESPSIGDLRGNSDRKNLVFIQGNASILVESRNRGTCELITDMVTKFIVWSRPLLCDTQGFKEFGMPMNVSDLTLGKDDLEKFSCNIQFPYMLEESWSVREEALPLKGFFTSINLA
jgi:hypothetical protein